MSWDLKYTTHTKGHYEIEDPELKFSKKGAQKDSNQRTKGPKTLKCLNGMGMKNKWILMFAMCCNPVVSTLVAT